MKIARRIVSNAFCAISIALILFAFPTVARQSQGTNSTASRASISGRITAISGEGATNVLPGVTVKLTGPSAGPAPQLTASDAEGHYEFTQLAAGTYTMEASADGFKAWSATITLGANQALVKDIVLQISSVNQQVEVQGEAAEIATQNVAITATVNTDQLESLPLPTQKFTEALSLIPGVVRTHTGKLTFKGQAESQGMLVVDSAENVDPVSGSFSIPIPVDIIQSMTVYSLPESSQYGGFTGGLTTIETMPPSGTWEYKLRDFIPAFRGKNDSLVGLANWTPRFEFGGPLIKNKVNFSEEVTYELRRQPVRGLSFPVNEIKTRSVTSLTNVQVILSPRHVLNFNVNTFPMELDFANINALIPQSASTNYGRSGVSGGFSDSYQFVSGAVLNTMVRYTFFDSNAHGQGPADMQISPEGWGGNYFNRWNRKANQLEVLPAYQLSAKSWHGTHEVRFGADVLHRQYDGRSISRPIDLVAQDGSVAERIDFQGAGLLRATDTEVAEFIQDRWTINSHLTLNYGARLTTQSIGRAAAFAPRIGAAYSLNGGNTVIRAGAAEVYGHVPLLAADFTSNQERMLSFFDSTGALIGQPIVLVNTYLLSGAPPSTPGVPRDPGSSPRTFSWNVVLEHQFRKNLNLRASYLDSHTVDLFLLDQIVDMASGTGLLAVRNTGTANYRQADITAHYRFGNRADMSLSYTWSRGRGDLNTLSDTLVPFQIPVIRPNLTGIMSSDVPHRVVASGFFGLPWKMVISPVVDVHSGLPYSNVDVLQNYAGVPDSQRFPVYFSLDVRLYREFGFHIPRTERSKAHKARLGVYSTDITNRLNPHDVFNNITSPFFGQFAGFQRRYTGLVLDLVQ
ncbi:MAG TPA: TonB-dependent receptor [Candidatus Elarobacter sp.]|nr:TonB-dependent receptor [Candidatus Elarobacter sp.]